MTQNFQTKTEAERRASPTRLTVLWSAVVQIEDQAVECVIVNISQDGAMIQLSSDIFCDNSVLLRTTRFGTLLAKTVWQDGRQVGLEFREDRGKLARQLESLLA